jgi:carbamoyltransferase
MAGRLVLGLGGSSHDFSAALMRGTDVLIAIESERITRVKYGTPAFLGDPFQPAVDYCLRATGVELGEVDRVVSSDLLPYRSLLEWSVRAFAHHTCHAASAAMLLDPEETACILVYDGNGSARPIPGGAGEEAAALGRLEVETFSAFWLEQGRLEKIGGTYGDRIVEWLGLYASCANSVGQLYELVSAAIGFDTREAGKTMGLAGWGRPRFLDLFHEYMTVGEVLEDLFRFDPFDRGFQMALARALADEGGSFAVRADIAATAQAVLTEALLAFYRTVEDREFATLCVAGGCGLNSVANGELAARLPAGRRLVVPPCTADTGIGLGALWLDAQARAERPIGLTVRGERMRSGVARPGRAYSIGNNGGLDLERVWIDPAVESPAALAERLAAGLVVGVFNGASEIGPRALGGRSIFADPRDNALKERINREIKHREPFRPLAPIVLASAFERFFEPAASANPFMLVVAHATGECRRLAPGVVHVDGTSRVQTVEPDGDPFLITLLEEFERLTGLPMLLNTSFNGRGEPIVETPADAIATFLALGLDGLWLEDRLLRPAARRSVPSHPLS